MPEKKTIEVSADVFEKLAQDKGKRTWDQQLELMHEMAYGTDYVRSPKLQDFNGGGLGGVVGNVRVASDGDLELVLRLPNGTPTAVANFDELAPNEEVTIEGRVKFGIDSTRRRRPGATNPQWLSRRC